MKETILFFILLVCLNLSCKKNSFTQKVTYEVTLVDCNSWYGVYLNENAEIITISNGQNKWSYKFSNTKGLKIASIAAYPESYLTANSEVFLKVFVNDKLVAQGRSSVNPQIYYDLE